MKQRGPGLEASGLLRSARASGCAVLWSEELNAGQKLAGVVVQKPFG